MAKAKKARRVYPLINEIVELIPQKRRAKVTFLDPRVIKVRWIDNEAVEEFSTSYFVDTYWTIAVRNYNV
jgi:hypothetical protein